MDEPGRQRSVKVLMPAGQSSNAAPQDGHFWSDSLTSAPQFVHVNAAAFPAFVRSVASFRSGLVGGVSGLAAGRPARITRSRAQVPFLVCGELIGPGPYAIRYDVGVNAKPSTAVRFRVTLKASGVPFPAVVRFTRKVKVWPGTPRYGCTVPFVRFRPAAERKSGKLRRGTAFDCARIAWVGIAAATRIAIMNTRAPFPAKRRIFRSPSQYGMTKTRTGINRMMRQEIALAVNRYSCATMMPRTTR